MYKNLADVKEWAKNMGCDIDKCDVLKERYEYFVNMMCSENNIAETTKRELNHVAQINDSTSHMESQLIGLRKSFEDCQLVADDVSMKTPN